MLDPSDVRARETAKCDSCEEELKIQLRVDAESKGIRKCLDQLLPGTTHASVSSGNLLAAEKLLMEAQR